MAITIDTHALVWYVDRDLNQKLSSRALEAIQKEEREGLIYIPIIVLMEMLYLYEKERINLSPSEILAKISGSFHHQIIPFDLDLFAKAQTIAGQEAHDRLIVATALLTNSPLVSKDRRIQKSSSVEVIW